MNVSTRWEWELGVDVGSVITQQKVRHIRTPHSCGGDQRLFISRVHISSVLVQH